MVTQDGRVPVAFLAFVLLWSSGYVVGALSVDVASPLGVLALRLVLAVPPAVVLALRVPGWRQASLWRIAVAGVLLLGVQFAGVYGGGRPRGPAGPPSPGVARGPAPGPPG